MTRRAFDRGYEAAIADMRWLAERRNEYGGPRNIQTVNDIEALNTAERSIYEAVRSTQHVADILEGSNDGYGWLPSWRWDEWEARKRGTDD